ncbi:MAG: hypothetical protein PWP67_2087 [Clostridium butyricum]|jgi:hypothetical protein|nr:hypothetical protein [Clostridium butyricum]
MPEESKNTFFYEKFGFKIMVDGDQCNFAILIINPNIPKAIH